MVLFASRFRVRFDRLENPGQTPYGHQIARDDLRQFDPGIGGAGGRSRKQADRLACEAWSQRMLGYKGPAQPSPALGDALNAGYRYLEVRCLGCDTHQTVALDIVRRPKATPIHELERYMRCKDCSQVRGYPYKRSHLVPRHSDYDSLDVTG
jgi:hypothetical protein